MGQRVHLQVALRELHAVNVADLTGQVEDDIAPVNHLRGQVADICVDDPQIIVYRPDVVKVASTPGSRLSTTVTAAPSFTSWITRLLPMNPSPSQLQGRARL